MNRISILLLVLSMMIYSCMSDPVEYPEKKLYENKIDTASLSIKVTNTNQLPVRYKGIEMQLLMFDSENLFLSQQTIPPITTRDTSFVLKGIEMGHYSFVLLSKVVGLENLRYLVEGEHTYQNVMDTLQYLLSEGYLAVNEKVIVNNAVNVTTVNWQAATSVISQVKFNLRTLLNSNSWKNPEINAKLHLLMFQNGTLCDNRLLSVKNLDSIRQTGIFYYPVAKGANYTFMVADIDEDAEARLKNKKTTIDSVQILLEKKIDNIRMAYNASLKNLTKAEETVIMSNAIESVDVNLRGTTTPSWTTAATGWSLMIFDGSGYLKRVIIKDGKMTTADAWKINVFKEATYTLLAVGNAQRAVGEFKAMGNIKSQYILDNLQEKQDNPQSWLGYGTGKITQLALGSQYSLTPEKRLKFSELPVLSIKEAKTHREANYFANHPTKITGVVTNNGRTSKNGVESFGLDNPISNLFILQDLSSVTEGEAILIEFKNSPTDLNIGDQITLALQDGEFTTANTNASNMTVFQKVTYTRVGEKTTGVDLPAKTLSLSEFTQTNYSRYEGMLIQVNENVEFKWFKDLQFNTLTPDQMILRDASVAATTLPSSRKTINMQIGNAAIPTFAGKLLPAGKGKISGFLVKTKSGGQFAVHPRGMNDVVLSNGLLDRVDQNIVAKFTNTTTSPVGVGRENSVVSANSKLGSGNLTANPLKMWMVNGESCLNKGIYIDINTSNMTKDEALKISTSGLRYGGFHGYSALDFDIKYSLDNGSTWVQVKDGSSDVKLTMGVGFGATNTTFTLSETIINNIGGYEKVRIALTNIGGSVSTTAARDRELEFNHITITQFVNE